MRNIGHAVFVPTLIATVLLVFLSSTFAVAKLLTSLSADTSLSSLLATWAVTMVASVILLRQIPRLFEGRPKQGAI